MQNLSDLANRLIDLAQKGMLALATIALLLAVLFSLNPFSMYRHDAVRIAFRSFLVAIVLIALYFFLDLQRPA